MDVLGFKDLLDNRQIITINEYFTFIGSSLKNAVKKRDINYFVASDSLCLFVEKNKEKSLFDIVEVIGILQCKLLKKGILLRGGISCGEIYSDLNSNVVFGQALVEAYVLESKFSKYPRVILDDKVFDDKNDDEILRSFSDGNGFCFVTKKASDFYDYDYFFVDYMSVFFSSDVSAESCDLLFNKIESSYKKSDIGDKYKWLSFYALSSGEISLCRQSGFISNDASMSDSTINKFKRRCKLIGGFFA